MKRVFLATVYMALGALAIAPVTAVADPAAAAELREGDMKKLVFHTDPKPVTDTGFVTFDGAPLSLTDYRGKHVLLNFWATWCAPCRKEMPMLEALQVELGGDTFEVITVATGRNPPPAMKKFFADVGIENLPLHRDPDQSLAREMGIFGLPITIVIDPEGREIARLRGDADWASDSAKAVLRTLIGDPAG